jgi:hypothetical protein
MGGFTIGNSCDMLPLTGFACQNIHIRTILHVRVRTCPHSGKPHSFVRSQRSDAEHSFVPNKAQNPASGPEAKPRSRRAANAVGFTVGLGAVTM